MMEGRGFRFTRVALGVSVTVLCSVVAGCERDAWVGRDHAALSDASAGGLSGNVGGASGSGGARACSETLCSGHKYKCGDCKDNDGDGKVDMDDPDCLGPCQDAEDTFFGAIPGTPCVADCYFDQDTGLGNDGCLWSSRCDPRSPEGSSCSYDPSFPLPRQGNCATLAVTQAAECASVCGPLTPNGCDCFGCCEIPGAPTPAFVFLGSVDDFGNTCDLSHLADPARCRPCTQVAACRNPCETCERCVGKTGLPPSCGNGTACPAPVCPGGHPCGADCLPACPNGQACITGCCIDPPR